MSARLTGPDAANSNRCADSQHLLNPAPGNCCNRKIRVPSRRAARKLPPSKAGFKRDRVTPQPQRYSEECESATRRGSQPQLSTDTSQSLSQMHHGLAFNGNCVEHRDVRYPASLHALAEELAQKHRFLATHETASFPTVAGIVRHRHMMVTSHGHVAVERKLSSCQPARHQALEPGLERRRSNPDLQEATPKQFLRITAPPGLQKTRTRDAPRMLPRIRRANSASPARRHQSTG